MSVNMIQNTSLLCIYMVKGSDVHCIYINCFIELYLEQTLVITLKTLLKLTEESIRIMEKGNTLWWIFTKVWSLTCHV